MNSRYCARCGAKHEEEARYCVSCGAPRVAAKAKVPAKDTLEISSALSHDDLTKDTLELPTVVAGHPKSIDHVSSIDSAWQPINQDLDQAEPERLTIGLNSIILIFVVVGLVAGAVILLAIVKPWEVAEPVIEQPVVIQESSEQNELPASEIVQESSGIEETVPNETMLDEAQVHEALLGYYSELATYEERVKACAEDFNSTYTLTNVETRTTASNLSEQLLDELSRQLDEISEMQVPTTSKNYQSFVDIKTLYDALLHRVSVLAEAWRVSLQYPTPSEHIEEIMAPLGKDNVSGVNKYKTEYERLYPLAAPKAP